MHNPREHLNIEDFFHSRPGKTDNGVLAVKDSNNISLRLGNGNGTFSSVTTDAVGSVPLEIAVADLNKSGNLDVAVTNLGSNTVGPVPHCRRGR